MGAGIQRLHILLVVVLEILVLLVLLVIPRMTLVQKFNHQDVSSDS